MQKRNLTPQCLVISLVTCFLLLSQPLIKSQFIQATAWAGNTKWSDAFGSSQGGTPPPTTRSGGSESGWNTGFDNQNNSPDSYNQPVPKRDRYEQPNSNQREETSSHSQTQEKSVQTDSDEVSAADSSTTAEDLLILFGLPAIIEETTEQSIEFLIKRSPEAALYADVYREFGKRYLTWENLKEPMIKRYTESFSSQELQQLKIFFSSATGKKYSQKSYKLIQETTQDIQKCLLSYQEDLKRMIVEKEIAQFNKQN